MDFLNHFTIPDKDLLYQQLNSIYFTAHRIIKPNSFIIKFPFNFKRGDNPSGFSFPGKPPDYVIRMISWVATSHHWLFGNSMQNED